MARLNNQRWDGKNSIPEFSYGPFLAIADGVFVFDPNVRDRPNWLGFNASAIFGVAHALASWTHDDSDEFKRILQAHDWLLQRIKRSFAGRIRLSPSSALSHAELVNQYICLSVLDQFADAHEHIASAIRKQADSLSEEFPHLIENVITDEANFEFQFTFSNSQHAKFFQVRAVEAGIFIQPQESVAIISFQLNLSFRDEYLHLFFERVRKLLSNFQNASFEFDSPDIQLPTYLANQYEIHSAILCAKAVGKLEVDYRAENFLKRQLARFKDEFTVDVIDASTYPRYRTRILAMQTAVYEPVRRTPPEEFDMLFASEKPLAILVQRDDEIVAMTFAGQLGLFTQERGVAQDPWVKDASTYYSMDLTISPDFRGGLGRTMKQAQLLLAIENGVTAVHGRNRDRLASGMWAINLALGSYELQNLKDDYPDQGKFRDCIYYRCPLAWEFDFDDKARELVRKSMPEMVSGALLGKRILR